MLPATALLQALEQLDFQAFLPAVREGELLCLGTGRAAAVAVGARRATTAAAVRPCSQLLASARNALRPLRPPPSRTLCLSLTLKCSSGRVQGGREGASSGAGLQAQRGTRLRAHAGATGRAAAEAVCGGARTHTVGHAALHGRRGRGRAGGGGRAGSGRWSGGSSGGSSRTGACCTVAFATQLAPPLQLCSFQSLFHC